MPNAYSLKKKKKMSKEKSIFGQQSEQLQLFLDTRLEKYNKPWYSAYFDWATPQMALTFADILVEENINAMASIVERDSVTPVRSREALQKITGEIPAIREKIALSESQMREFLTMQQLQNVNDQTKRLQALRLIWDDTKKVVDSINNALDYLALQAVSKGEIEFKNAEFSIGKIDLLMPSTNKKSVGTAWSDPTAKILTDIIDAIQGADTSFAKILISKTKYLQLMKNKEVREVLGSFFGLSKTAATSQTAPLTLDRLNQYMEASKLPQFEIVDKKVKVEGEKTLIEPFEGKNLAFIPEGKLGVIRNAFAVEELRPPVDNTNYALVGRTLVSKWSEKEPFREWTKAECNAFPSVTAINQIHLLTTEL